jgi:hypothetical protein
MPTSIPSPKRDQLDISKHNKFQTQTKWNLIFGLISNISYLPQRFNIEEFSKGKKIKFQERN